MGRMSEMLKMLFSLSLAGTLLLCLLWLLRPLYKNRLSKSWQYYIWLLVIFRFLIPLTPNISLVGELFRQVDQRSEQAESSVQMSFNWENNTKWEEGNPPIYTNSPQLEPELESSRDKLWQGLWIIWLVTAMAMFIRRITLYQSFVKYLKAGSVMVEDIRLLDQMGKMAERNHIRGRVELWTNSLISSPLLLGFFHPRIVLATKDLPDTDFYYTILHELTHYKRRDMFYKWLVQFVVCVHWFNPFVYYMERKLNQACELACDEAVLKGLDNRAKRDYGDMLLRAVGLGGSYKSSAASVTLHESKKLLKGRLEAIMEFGEKTKRNFTLSVLITSLLAVSGAAVGAYVAPASAKTENTTIKTSIAETSIATELLYEIPPEEEEEVPWFYQYRQSWWREDDYMFQIGWNIDETAWESYIGEEFSLIDNSAMYVMFDEESDWLRADSDAMQALKKLLFRLREQKKDSNYPLLYPIVVSGEYIGNIDADILADIYYMDDELSKFAAIFEKLDRENQEDYLENFYVNDEIEYLSVILKYMDYDLLQQYIVQAYVEDEIDVFAILIPFFKQEDIEILYRQTIHDNRRDYRDIVLNYIKNGNFYQEVIN